MAANGDQHTILVVDDDQGLSALMQKHLIRAGYQAVIAGSGAEALETIGRGGVDLMLLDFGLADMNGLELTRLLAERQQSVPFIVITGRGDERVAVEMMKSGARDYLSKDGAMLELLPSVVAHTLERLDRDRRLARAEQTIRQQKRFLESVLNSLSQPLYVIDAQDYSIKMINEAARRQHPGQGPDSHARIHETDQFCDDTACPVDEVRRTKAPAVIEHVHYVSDGEVRIFEIHGSPIFDERGEVREVIEYHLDVTQRRRAEQALRDSEARLRQLVESLPIILISREPRTHRYLTMIGSVQEMVGYDARQLIADPQLGMKLLHDEDRARVLQTFADAFTTRRPYEVEFRIHHGTDGHLVWLREHVVPILDEDESPIRLDAVVVDVTEEKKAAHERYQFEARLQQAAKLESLGILAGGIAHDFNNLLTVISGNTQFMQESLSLGPAEAKALTDIETATRSAIDMTRSLQAFSRPGKPEIRTIDANILIEETYRFLRRLIPRRIDFRLDPHPHPCLVAVDSAQMQQVLVNLCVNARDAMPGEGCLDIQTRLVEARAVPPRLGAGAEAGRYVRICVADDGCGMDPDTLRQVFDPFFTTKAKDQGTGLGLAIVYRIVEAHMGVIDVQSEPGKGTTFSIFFPEASAETQQQQTPPPPVARGTERILVVDDEPMIASLLKTLLESNGHTVAVCHDPVRAVEMARDGGTPFELAVVDYSLPGMNGRTCLARLRELQPDMKGLLITGYQIEDWRDDPAVRLLRKPFTAQSIARTVREILDEATTMS